MLTFEQIENIYKKTEPQNTKRRMMLVEYIQYEILDSLFKQKRSESLSFIGGTSIRIAYSGNRFSEDLDFDNFSLSFEQFSELMQEVVRDMKIKGFEIESRSVEKGAYHCYVRFPHILSANGLAPTTNEKVLVRIDTMKKEIRTEPKIFKLNKFELYRPIPVNDPDIILSQKLIAIVERKREKGRDLYDVNFLFGFAKPDFDYIEKILGINRQGFARKLFERCDTFDLDTMAKDVEPFLIVPDQIARVKTFGDYIRTKL